MEQEQPQWKTLISKAEHMLEKAYVPYSHFPVGAAVVTKDGKIFTGCNIENASYGLSNCAERTAIFKAVSEGYTTFGGLAIMGNTDEPIAPCGACRQVIAEFFESDTPILLLNSAGKSHETTIQKLLPGAFRSGDMET